MLDMLSPMEKPSFIDEVIEATGLAPMIAAGVLERCCRRAGVNRHAMTPRDLEKLLPHLEPALLVYVSGREVMAALERLKQLVGGTSRRLMSESFIRVRDGEYASRRLRGG